MEKQLRLILFYKDGTAHKLKVRIPAEVGNKIAINGLVRSEIYVEDIAGTNTAKIITPTLADFENLRKGNNHNG